jgi:hypothetical protein
MGKIKKTDSAVKTVEAWWALIIADGSLGQSIIRWVWPMIGVGVGTWVASATDWIGSYGVAGWAATAMLGALGFVWIAVDIDHFRSRQRILAAPETTSAEIDALVTARLNEFLASTLRPEFATHAQMHGHDEKFNELAKQAADARTVANGAVEALDALKRQLDDWTHNHACNQDQRFKFVDRGFLAIWHRELMSEIELRIDKKSDWLLRSRRGERIDNWGQWNHKKGEFSNDVLEWLRLAETYVPGISNKVNDIPPHRLIGEWPEPDDLFPNVDAITAYRAAAVLLENYQGQRHLAHRALEAAAFHSPSMRG